MAPQLPLGMPTLEGGAEDEPRHSLQGLGEQRLPRRHPPPQVLLRFLSGPGCPDLSQGWSDPGHAPGLAGGEAAESSQL